MYEMLEIEIKNKNKEKEPKKPLYWKEEWIEIKNKNKEKEPKKPLYWKEEWMKSNLLPRIIMLNPVNEIIHHFIMQHLFDFVMESKL